jgi:hypothetical protein
MIPVSIPMCGCIFVSGESPKATDEFPAFALHLCEATTSLMVLEQPEDSLNVS